MKDGDAGQKHRRKKEETRIGKSPTRLAFINLEFRNLIGIPELESGEDDEYSDEDEEDEDDDVERGENEGESERDSEGAAVNGSEDTDDSDANAKGSDGESSSEDEGRPSPLRCAPSNGLRVCLWLTSPRRAPQLLLRLHLRQANPSLCRHLTFPARRRPRAHFRPADLKWCRLTREVPASVDFRSRLCSSRAPRPKRRRKMRAAVMRTTALSASAVCQQHAQ